MRKKGGEKNEAYFFYDRQEEGGETERVSKVKRPFGRDQ